LFPDACSVPGQVISFQAQQFNEFSCGIYCIYAPRVVNQEQNHILLLRHVRWDDVCNPCWRVQALSPDVFVEFSVLKAEMNLHCRNCVTKRQSLMFHSYLLGIMCIAITYDLVSVSQVVPRHALSEIGEHVLSLGRHNI
jgi:hypothetical protein